MLSGFNVCCKIQGNCKSNSTQMSNKIRFAGMWSSVWSTQADQSCDNDAGVRDTPFLSSPFHFRSKCAIMRHHNKRTRVPGEHHAPS